MEISTQIERWQQNGLYFAAKKTAENRWLVWCSFEPVVANSPVHENPAQCVWFEPEVTKQAAIDRLLAEIG